jgi:Lipoprotein LpqB beta-propeller domain/Sporulation and spore germination
MVAAGCAIAVVTGGCVGMPTSGPVQQVDVPQGGAGQTINNAQPIPVPPGPGWRPFLIVTGFLAASTSFANGHAVARDYLTPAMRKRWNPGWAATVVVGPPNVIVAPVPQKIVGAQQTATANVVGQRLAALTSTGQYVISSGTKETDHFTLVNIAGQWRISRLPSLTSLILAKPDFLRDYKPRNLYFFGPYGALVPDPVFVPQQATNAEPVRGLVDALLERPTGWLSEATKTDFPAGTKVLGVRIVGNSAVVDLGGSAARASAGVLRKMAAQLVWTLTSSSYSPSDIQSVQLLINGQVRRPLDQLQELRTYASLMPARTAGSAYFLSSGDGVKLLPGGAQPARPVPWPAGISQSPFASQYPFTAIAVQPGGAQIAGILAEPKGCRVYSGALRHGASMSYRQINSGSCASLSWDFQGDIWVAAGTHVWMLPAGGGAAVPVFLPGRSPGAGPSASLPPGDTIAALRVAPDGVRIAMIVHGPKKSAEILLGAISSNGRSDVHKTYIGQNGAIVTIGTDVLDPTALSWYDADHVLVLGQSREGHGPELYNVPLTGGASSPIVTDVGTVSITSAGSELVAGTTRGQILMGSGPDPTWREVGQGRVPAFPG